MSYKNLMYRFTKVSKESKDPATKEISLALVDLVKLIEKDNDKALRLATYAINLAQ